MASDKKPTQAMPNDGLAGTADGTNRPGEAPLDADPHRAERPGKGFAGGQSERAYHGSHQLGDKHIEGKDNPNAAASED
ncbi:hypothetical protein GRI75_09595 [Altererythrobacter soli]|uniref:Uncharacterized protein n=1 Tax=Croceibacterium soli TaxID=1739690 RepID=A0A6I4USK3_9SPHN|nr:hypothetical protein [Croceibacterium soli]MXP41892.1 hypothetical protein [Croceibacterium soli]